jgi:hypothetical protein
LGTMVEADERDCRFLHKRELDYGGTVASRALAVWGDQTGNQEPETRNQVRTGAIRFFQSRSEG